MVETVEDEEVWTSEEKKEAGSVVAPRELDIYEDRVPMASCVVHSFQEQKSGRPLLVLFDSGSSGTWWNARSLPKGCTPTRGKQLKSSTLAGTFESNLQVKAEHILFP